MFNYARNTRAHTQQGTPAKARWVSSWDFKVLDSVKKCWVEMVRDVVVRQRLVFEDPIQSREFKDPSGFIASFVESRSLLIHP